jgi:D-serine deaminase-like pyridoxal phosphate-dependent protein
MDLARVLAATEDIITPVAVVDEEVVERNLARMAKLAADQNVKLRPHAKTHKSAYMAKRQMAHGAVGLTCATFTEAEVFAGWRRRPADSASACWQAEARSPGGAGQPS